VAASTYLKREIVQPDITRDTPAVSVLSDEIGAIDPSSKSRKYTFERIAVELPGGTMD
jgi:hypothetical protein